MGAGEGPKLRWTPLTPLKYFSWRMGLRFSRVASSREFTRRPRRNTRTWWKPKTRSSISEEGHRAWADFTNDGQLDAVSDGRFFVNRGSTNGWLEVRIRGDGKKVNRSAIGTQVRIRRNDRILTRQVEAGTGEGIHPASDSRRSRRRRALHHIIAALGWVDDRVLPCRAVGLT